MTQPVARWEYLFYRQGGTEYITFGRAQSADTMQRLRAFLGPVLKKETPARIDLDARKLDFMAVATFLGYEGWEMVQVNWNGADWVFMFKRQVVE